MNFDLIDKVGLGGWVLVVIILLLIWIVKTVITESSHRDKTYATLINNHMSTTVKTMEHLIVDMDSNSKSSAEAHKFQREEHNKQIESLTKLVTTLDSIDRRINGRK